MRMRKKPNLIPRMERCAHVLIQDPPSMKGNWLSSYPDHQLLWVELGCGKGRFTVDTARENPQALVAAVEKIPDAMIVAMERVCGDNIENVRFIDGDALCLPLIFDDAEVDRIFINFCDPWPRNKTAKFRLTHPNFLKLYESALKPEGEIWFKTDNSPLFEWSLEMFTKEGWSISELTRDLHENGIVGVMTDYEAKFHAEGVKINRLVARKERSI